MPSEPQRWEGCPSHSQPPPPPGAPSEPLRVFSPDQPAPGATILSSAMTLSEFFRLFIEPVWMAERRSSRRTVLEYRRAIALWQAFTGDPPLRLIDDFATSKYLVGLYELAGRKAEKLAFSTVHKLCRCIQTCLNQAGPRSRRFRKAQRLLADVPFLEKPELDLDTNEDSFSLAEVAQILAAVPRATRPQPAPELWWTNLVVLAYNTGERRGAMLGVTLGDLSEEKPHLYPQGRLAFPSGIRKGRRRSKLVPLNAPARAAIEAMRPYCASESEPIFGWPGWPKTDRSFHAHWERILIAAAIPEERRFGLHGLRKATP